MNENQDSQNLGKVMIICACVLVILLLALFFNHWSNKNNLGGQPQFLDVNGTKEIVLKRNYYNQYKLRGQINGKDVIFLLDTGAGSVLIPESVAQKLNLTKGPQSKAMTAGDDIIIFPTRIKELIIGNIILKDIYASISPDTKGDEVLLGMSALRKLNFRQEGDTLIISVQ